MKYEEVREVLACLSDDRGLYKNVFWHFRDRYCFEYIEYEMDHLGKTEMSVAELKAGKLRRYLQKPVLRNALKSCAEGVVKKRDLPALWPVEVLPFAITLSSWGEGDRDWDQTSRNQCNLVLQINFDRKHVKQYQRLIKPGDQYGPFEYWGHPVRQDCRKTLSWVRMDIAFDTGEVLIEEIQNDWLRKAQRIFLQMKKRRLVEPSLQPRDVFDDILGKYEDFEYYVTRVLEPYRRVWAEASMLAAIKFIREEVGISTIYYHCFETGKKLKNVCGAPPRSMYTQLPRQFGFQLAEQPPEFLLRDKFTRRCLKALKGPRWFRLDI